jgi:DNA mismatch repair protein MutL
MTTRVRILPEQLTNKIAAGEVVERPASVVKELVENALDAGGSDIIVEIEDGGKRLIRVTDNGSGMTREDALLSMERHATSKIGTDADLFNLHTLGFRGEALPSIASVSRFTLASRERGALEGAEIYAEGGRIREVKACGMAEGTVVSVRNLFFNTPARLKFMKSRDTETGHIGEFLHRLALSRPDVRFTYMCDGKTVFRLLPGGMADRAGEILGKTVAAELYPLEVDDNGVALKGLLGSPSVSRSAAAHLYTYINGRFIRDRVVQHALLQGYRNVLERGRYPVLVLFITVPAADVDVNVHPTKHEVRFREQAKIHAVIQNGVEQLLRSGPWLGKGSVLPRQPAATTSATPSLSRVEEVKESLLRYAVRQENLPLPRHACYPQPSPQQPMGSARPPETAIPRAPSAEPDPAALPTGEGYFAGLQVIGQFRNAYIVCQDGSDLLLIDQHAAHERVVFQELRRSLEGGTLDGQGLLFPETIDLSPAESAIVREHGDELQKLAFDLEHFGGTTWLLKGVPQLLAGLDYKQALRDTLEEFCSLGRSGVSAEIIDDILATIACHSVVRGQRQLAPLEIQRLLQRMDGTEFAANCPHGRPVIARITHREIEKLFKRV